MKHRAAPEFWRLFDQLPARIQTQARENYERLKANPRHPSLHLKQIGRFWSVRVGRRHRALGVSLDDGVLWFWIGTHADYDKLSADRGRSTDSKEKGSVPIFTRVKPSEARELTFGNLAVFEVAVTSPSRSRQ